MAEPLIPGTTKVHALDMDDTPCEAFSKIRPSKKCIPVPFLLLAGIWLFYATVDPGIGPPLSAEPVGTHDSQGIPATLKDPPLENEQAMFDTMDDCSAYTVPELGVGHGHLLMTPEELDLLQKTLSRIGGDVLEWGTGGTTEIIPAMVRSLTSIESDPQWCTTMVRKPNIQCWMSQKKLRYFCAGVEHVTEEYSRPKDKSLVGEGKAYEYYVRYPDMLGKYDFDVAFVDGRFRNAVAVNALKYLNSNGRVMMHDFQRYEKEMSQWFTIEERAGSLAVLKPILHSSDVWNGYKSYMGDAE